MDGSWSTPSMNATIIIVRVKHFHVSFHWNASFNFVSWTYCWKKQQLFLCLDYNEVGHCFVWDTKREKKIDSRN